MKSTFLAVVFAIFAAALFAPTAKAQNKEDLLALKEDLLALSEKAFPQVEYWKLVKTAPIRFEARLRVFGIPMPFKKKGPAFGTVKRFKDRETGKSAELIYDINGKLRVKALEVKKDEWFYCIDTADGWLLAALVERNTLWAVFTNDPDEDETPVGEEWRFVGIDGKRYILQLSAFWQKLTVQDSP